MNKLFCHLTAGRLQLVIIYYFTLGTANLQASQVSAPSGTISLIRLCQQALGGLAQIQRNVQEAQTQRRELKKKQKLGVHLDRYLALGFLESEAKSLAEIDLLIQRNWSPQVAARLKDELSKRDWERLVYKINYRPEHYYRGVNISADSFIQDPGTRIWVSNEYSKAANYTTASSSSFVIRYQFTADMLRTNPHNRVCADGAGSFCISERIPEYTVIEALPTDQLLFADAIQFPNLSEKWFPIDKVLVDGRIVLPKELN